MPFTRSNAIPLIFFGSGLTLAATLSLTGCTGTPAVEPSPLTSSSSSSASVEPTETSSATETPAPEPTPEITPPAKPEAMKHNNEEGAIAFANYFLDVLEYSAASGDVSLLGSVSDPACQFCNDLAKRVSQAEAAGQKYENLNFTAVGGFVLAIESENIYGFRAPIEISEHQVVDEQKTIIKKSTSETTDGAILVFIENGEWKVDSFGEESK